MNGTALATALALTGAMLYAGRALVLKLPPAAPPLADLLLLQSLLSLPIAVFIAVWRDAPLMPQRAGCAAHLARGLMGMLHTALLLAAMLQLPAGLALTLGFTAPLFYALLAWLAGREAVGRRVGGALVAGFVGVALIAQPGAVPAQASAMPAALGAGLVGALITFSVRRVVARGERAETLMVSFTAIQSTAAAAWWLATRDPSALLAPWTLAAGAAAGLLSTLAQLAVTLGHCHGSASLVNALSFVAIPAAALGAWCFLGEQLVPAAWLGAALVAAGSAVVLRTDLRPAMAGGRHTADGAQAATSATVLPFAHPRPRGKHARHAA